MDNLIADIIGDIALALAVSTLLAALARRLGQPAVIGQILCGIMLGPSLLGHLPGHLASHLFPAAALPHLDSIARFAVCLFMFVVGYELNGKSLRLRCRPAITVAVGALAVPMLLGIGAAIIFKPEFRHVGQSNFSHSFILFMGVATSITALPVLAAITRERGIAGTEVGITVTAAAGIMDVTAWIVLAAALVGTTASSGRPWPEMLLLAVVFAAVMLLIVRPLLGWWIRRPEGVPSSQLPLALTLTLGSAWVTASLGLHPVFGALLAGLAMPGREAGADPDVLIPMEQVSGVLLPLFFVVIGLSVNVSALNGTALALVAIFFVIATAGKAGSGYIAARISGFDRKDSASIAALVNTRGLTELIALNVGLSAGLISDRLFSVLVLMAVLTTLMTSPSLSLIRLRTAVPAAELGEVEASA